MFRRLSTGVFLLQLVLCCHKAAPAEGSKDSGMGNPPERLSVGLSPTVMLELVLVARVGL